MRLRNLLVVTASWC